MKVEAFVHCYYCDQCKQFEGAIEHVVPKGLEKSRKKYVDKSLWDLKSIWDPSEPTRIDGDRIGYSIEYNHHRIASVWDGTAKIQGDHNKNIWIKAVVLECLSTGEVRKTKLENMYAKDHQHNQQKKLEKSDPAYWENLGLTIMDSLNIPKSQQHQHSYLSHKSDDEKKSIKD